MVIIAGEVLVKDSSLVDMVRSLHMRLERRISRGMRIMIRAVRDMVDSREDMADSSRGGMDSNKEGMEGMVRVRVRTRGAEGSGGLAGGIMRGR